MQEHLTLSELGKKSKYDSEYSPSILFPIARKHKREQLGLKDHRLPFHGVDCWHHYEVSWLNAKGKPVTALAKIIYDCESPNIVESKSLKLYFNSLNNTCFENLQHVQQTIQRDLSFCIGSSVVIEMQCPTSEENAFKLSTPQGLCLDDFDISCSEYEVNTSFLYTHHDLATETLYSNLFRSNCPVTNQPDWGTIQLEYQGSKIDQEGLLRYIVSYRNHMDFHEQCIERIFLDIMSHCQPEFLVVCGYFTRRGGLDINPCRATRNVPIPREIARLRRQ